MIFISFLCSRGLDVMFFSHICKAGYDVLVWLDLKLYWDLYCALFCLICDVNVLVCCSHKLWSEILMLPAHTCSVFANSYHKIACFSDHHMFISWIRTFFMVSIFVISAKWKRPLVSSSGVPSTCPPPHLKPLTVTHSALTQFRVPLKHLSTLVAVCPTEKV